MRSIKIRIMWKLKITHQFIGRSCWWYSMKYIVQKFSTTSISFRWEKNNQKPQFFGLENRNSYWNIKKYSTQVFLANFSEYGSITSDDLWNALQSAYNEKEKEGSNNLSIKEIMRAWVEQQGYPIVNVTRNYETGKVFITQEGNLQGHKSNRWWIPINFATKSNANFDVVSPTHWLKPGDENIVIDGVDKDDWIIVNIQQSGTNRLWLMFFFFAIQNKLTPLIDFPLRQRVFFFWKIRILSRQLRHWKLEANRSVDEFRHVWKNTFS